MRAIVGLLLGVAASIVLCTLWLAVAWLWSKYGWNIASFIANPGGNDRGHLGFLELVPPVAGGFIFYVGIGASVGMLAKNRVSLRTFAWTVSLICALFTLALSAFMFLVSYRSSGATSFMMAVYGLAMLVIPGAAIFLGARHGLERA